MFSERLIDKIPKDFCLKRGDAITQKNEDFHVVIKALSFNSFVSVPVIVCAIFFPEQM
jgi:hypothetical protein